MDLMKLQNGSDIRGVAIEGVEGENVNLTPQIARQIGCAYVSWLAKKLDVDATSLHLGVGRDSRVTGPALAEALIEGMFQAAERNNPNDPYWKREDYTQTKRKEVVKKGQEAAAASSTFTEGSSSEKSNFSNGTDIDNVKSQVELEAQAASSTFTTVLAKRDNRAKTRELYGLIESKFGKKVKNNAEAVAELMRPEHKLDLSSNDLDTVIDQVKNCR